LFKLLCDELDFNAKAGIVKKTSDTNNVLVI